MTREPVTMGIDVGTTRIKAEVVALDRRELHAAATATPWRHTSDGTQAQVDELGDAAIAVAAEAAEWAAAHGFHVAAMAVTGMAETGALLDGEGCALAPAFAWHHTMGDPVRVQDSLGRERFMAVTGRDCTISPSIIKLDMLRTSGHRFSPGQRWLNIPDYVAYRLSGVQAAEISTSSRTGLVDIARREWWDAALEFLGAGRWLLPGDLVPGGTLLGPTAGDLPESLRGIQVSTGGHDHPVAGIGAGASEPGCLILSLGTAEAQLRIVAPPMSPRTVLQVVAGGGTVDWHPLGDRLTVLGALPTGITLERLSGVLRCTTLEERLGLSRTALECEPHGGAPRLDGVTFDSFNLIGIADGVTAPAVWRGANEDLIDISTALTRRVNEAIGPYDDAVAFGGWLADPLVRALRQRQLGVRATFTSLAEPGAVGAAMLAAWAAGEISQLPGTHEVGVHLSEPTSGKGGTIASQRGR